MLIESVKVSTGKGDQKVEHGPYDYEYPETLAEAIQKDGEEKVFSLYKQQRKIRFMDDKRREVTGGPSNEMKKMTKILTDAIKSDPEKAKKVLADMGINLDELLAAAAAGGAVA